MSQQRALVSGAFSVAILLLSVGSALADPLALRVTRAEAAFDQRNSEPVVTMLFDDASRRSFAEFTARNVGKVMELRVDGRVVMKPVIREPITGGAGQIAGGLTLQQARDMAERLSTGVAKLEVEAVAD